MAFKTVMVDIKKVLTRVKELLDDPEKWVQGTLYGTHMLTDWRGSPPYIGISTLTSADTDCYCLIGATNKAVSEMYPELTEAIMDRPYNTAMEVVAPIAVCIVERQGSAAPYTDKRKVVDAVSGPDFVVMSFNDTKGEQATTHADVLEVLECAINSIDDDAVALVQYEVKNGGDRTS